MTTEADPHRRLPIAPLAPLALAVAAGIIADRFAWAQETASWAVLAAAATAASGLLWRRAAGGVALLVAFAALGGGWHHHRWSDLAPDDLARGATEEARPAWVRGVLTEVPTFRPGEADDPDGTTRSVLEVTGIHDDRGWREASGRAQLSVVGDRTDLKAGEPIQAAGVLAAIAGPSNPGELDRRLFYRAEGIRLRMAVGASEGVWADPRGTIRFVLRALGVARAWSYGRLVAELPPDVAPLAAALLLGRRAGVDPEVNDAFLRTGTTHLLAISGLHFQVLAGALWLALRVVGLGRKPALLTLIVAMVGYVLLVGWMPSVVRAGAMIVTVCLGGLRDRCARPANLLAVAALITLWFNPAYLFDVGCQLSFLCVAALFWGVGPALRLVGYEASAADFTYHVVGDAVRGAADPLDALERRLEPGWKTAARGLGAWLLLGVAVSVVVWLVTWPLVALRFHLISPSGILLNVPLIALSSLALMAAGLILALVAVGGVLAFPAGWSCAWLLRWVVGLVRWGAGWGWGHVFVPGPPWPSVLGFYGLLALVAWASARRWVLRRWAWSLLGAWSAVVALATLLPGRPAALEAEVLDVAHGLAVVIRAPDGRTILYDCGRMRDPHVGRQVIAPALWARGVRRIDTVILSHADADHYNGLPDLLDRFAIGELRIPWGFGGQANPGTELLLDAARARGVPVRPLAAGDRWDLGGTATLLALHPPAGWRPGTPDNARSAVLELAEGGRRFLLTGDLEGEGLTELLTRPPRALDAILAPHHGGRSANPPVLYHWADPGVVVVSQRRPPPWTLDALEPLAGRGIPVLRTWQRGAIRLRWTETGLVARGFLDGGPEAGRSRGMSSAPIWPAAIGLVASSRSAWSRGAVAALGFALGLILCLVLAVVEWGAWTLVLPRRPPMSVATDDPPWEPIEVRAGDGVLLRGSWRPAAEAGGRTALLHHGFGEAGAALRPRAEALARLGWSVAVPDARGFGRSDGDRSSFGGREADDLRAWIDALAGRDGPDLFLVAWGRSMGAAVVLRAAAGDPRIRALILEAPYPDLVVTVGAWLARLHLPRALAGPLVLRAGTLAGVSLARPRPIDLAPSVRVPTLILHGTDDPIIPPAEAARLAAAFPQPAEVVEVAGARHGDVFDVGGPEVMERIAAFLAEVRTL
jgi:competence protein ComEC